MKLSSYSKHVNRPRIKPLDPALMDQAASIVADNIGVMHLQTTPGDDITYHVLRKFVERALTTIKMDSTPGYPLNLRFATNQ